MLCGHPPIIKDGASGSKFIVDKVRVALNRGELLSEAPASGGNFNVESVLQYAQLALRGVQATGRRRPRMNDVVQDLTQALKLEPRAQAGAAEFKFSSSSFSGSGVGNTISARLAPTTRDPDHLRVTKFPRRIRVALTVDEAVVQSLYKTSFKTSCWLRRNFTLWHWGFAGVWGTWEETTPCFTLWRPSCPGRCIGRI